MKPKAKQSPAPYRDDPFDDFQGSDLDRDALSQKASSINRIDLNARKETKKKRDLEAPNQAFKTRQAEAILEQTFSSSNRSSSSMTPRCKQILTTVSVAAVLLLIMASRAVESGPAILVLGLSIGALAYAANMTITLLERDTGTAKMQRVAGFIQEGAQGFFRTQFFAIISMAVVMCGMLFVGFLFRPKDPNVKVSPFTLAIITCVSFSVGATCSCLAGFVGLWISVRTNVRVASAARRSYVEAIQTGKYFKPKSEYREWSTVVEISMTPPSFKPVSLTLSRSPLF